MNKQIPIDYELYQRLLEHLQLHAPTDAWAALLLKELEEANLISVGKVPSNFGEQN